jgi:battenin
VFGYAWATVLHEWVGLSFGATLLLAWSLVGAWLGVFFYLLPPPPPSPGVAVSPRSDKRGAVVEEASVSSPLSPEMESPNCSGGRNGDVRANAPSVSRDNRRQGAYAQAAGQEECSAEGSPEGFLGEGPLPAELQMSFEQRLAFVASLWPFTVTQFERSCRISFTIGSFVRGYYPGIMALAHARVSRLSLTLSSLLFVCCQVPLTIVYFAEYAMQSGVWSAVGFPPTSSSAREHFYEYANWSYQLGVFASRSSGLLWQPSLRVLWALPLLQTLLLAFFWTDAIAELWYGPSLLVLCVAAGLAGGAIYVHGFKLLSASQPAQTRELACAAASVAADVGILIGSVAGLYIQACIYDRQGIDGASVTGGFCR